MAATTYTVIIGRVIALARKRAGLDQAEIARVLAVSQSSYSRVESGLGALSVVRLRVIARRLGTDAPTLLKQADDLVRDLLAQGVDIADEPNTTPLWLSDDAIDAMIQRGGNA